MEGGVERCSRCVFGDEGPVGKVAGIISICDIVVGKQINTATHSIQSLGRKHLHGSRLEAPLLHGLSYTFSG